MHVDAQGLRALPLGFPLGPKKRPSRIRSFRMETRLDLILMRLTDKMSQDWMCAVRKEEGLNVAGLFRIAYASHRCFGFKADASELWGSESALHGL